MSAAPLGDSGGRQGLGAAIESGGQSLYEEVSVLMK